MRVASACMCVATSTACSTVQHRQTATRKYFALIGNLCVVRSLAGPVGMYLQFIGGIIHLSMCFCQSFFDCILTTTVHLRYILEVKTRLENISNAQHIRWPQLQAVKPYSPDYQQYSLITHGSFVSSVNVLWNNNDYDAMHTTRHAAHCPPPCILCARERNATSPTGHVTWVMGANIIFSTPCNMHVMFIYWG